MSWPLAVLHHTELSTFANAFFLSFLLNSLPTLANCCFVHNKLVSLVSEVLVNLHCIN